MLEHKEPSALCPTCRQAIALRAYELFVERGGEHGKDVEDWIKAEKDVPHGPAVHSHS
jgi:Protein of unknown function (DUF2934)